MQQQTQECAFATQSNTSLEYIISEFRTFSNLRVIKNFVVLSVGCLLAFCAYDGLVMLQSTLNQDGGIGVISVAVQFGFSCITALLLPEYLFEKIGCKSVITVCLFLFVPYIASNFYPQWSLMIPASILIGLANSLYWAAQSTYLNHLSILYSWNLRRDEMAASSMKSIKIFDSVERIGGYRLDLNDEISSKCHSSDHTGIPNDLNKESVWIITNNRNIVAEKTETKLARMTYAHRNTEDRPTSSEKSVSSNPDREMTELLTSTTARFFGIHGLIYQTCHVWGNLLSYYVLRIGAVEEAVNASNTICQCGIDFCNNCSTDNLRAPEEGLRNLLTGVFVAISILAVIFVLFGLDELKNIRKNVTISWEYIAATCRQVKDKRQLLLIPMSLNIGIMQGFVMGDFTKDYVACAWGVHHVGLVTACLGAFLALSSSVSGCLVKHLGRRTLFFAAEGLNIAAVIAMYLWKPTSSETFMFFVISGLLGAVLGTFWSQLRAFYGVLFKRKEGAAFANYQLWHAIGMATTFAYSNFICTSVKIYIYISFSSMGMIGYLLAEKLHSENV